MSHSSLVGYLWSRNLRTRPGSYFLYFCSNRLECLSLLPSCTFCCPVVKPKTIQTSSICKPYCSLICRYPALACAEIHRCWYCKSSDSFSRSCSRIFWRCGGFGGDGETCVSLILCWFLSLSLLAQVILPLAHHYKSRVFLWHITISERILYLSGQPHPDSISQGRRIPIEVCSDNIKLSIVMIEPMVHLFIFRR